MPSFGQLSIKTPAQRVFLPPFVSGAADGAPHTIRRLHVDDVEPVPGRSPADDERVCWHEASHAVIGRHWSELGGVTCQSGAGYSGLTWGPQYDRLARFGQQAVEAKKLSDNNLVYLIELDVVVSFR